MSISRKLPDTEEYETEFSGAVDFFGTAVANKAAKLKRGDRILLTSVDVSQKYDKEKKIMYWNPKVFDFKMADDVETDSGGSSSSGSSSRRRTQEAYEGENEADDDGLPF